MRNEDEVLFPAIKKALIDSDTDPVITIALDVTLLTLIQRF